MFSCKVCAEKDRRIVDLKEQLEFCKKMLRPQSAYPTLNFEANRILDGANEPILEVSDEDINVDEVKEKLILESEFNNIVSGNY